MGLEAKMVSISPLQNYQYNLIAQKNQVNFKGSDSCDSLDIQKDQLQQNKAQVNELKEMGEDEGLPKPIRTLATLGAVVFSAVGSYVTYKAMLPFALQTLKNSAAKMKIADELSGAAKKLGSISMKGLAKLKTHAKSGSKLEQMLSKIEQVSPAKAKEKAAKVATEVSAYAVGAAAAFDTVEDCTELFEDKEAE